MVCGDTNHGGDTGQHKIENGFEDINNDDDKINGL
jgi:hypothetical protein